MKKGCIAVFAKTPDLSAVKTRLAETTGQKKADEVYALCVDCLEETLDEFKALRPDWDVVWTLAEEDAPLHDFWKNRCFDKIWTGDGELGTRLHQVFSTFKTKYENVILVGTDSPQLSSFNLIHAADVFKQSNAVIMPAHDGGYCLFGANFEIARETWEGVPYSASNTSAEFLKLLNSDVETLAPHADLDEIDDMKVVLSEMPNVPHRAQQKLIEVLKDYLS